MVIAGLNMMLGISILFMNGSDYEDWYVLYTPAALAVICGTILFYGSIFKRRIATLVYLIISSMSTMFYGISAVVLLALSYQIATTIGVTFLIVGSLKFFFLFCILSFLKTLQ